VRLSADEFVPYPPEELVVDQCLLRRLPDGQSSVLAVYAHRDIVDAHVAMLAGCGLDPERIHVSSACLASAGVAGAGAGVSCYALVNLASGGLEVLVLHDGHLEYTRGVAALHDYSEGDADVETLAEEVAVETRASLSAYRRESLTGAEVERIFVCSDWTDVGAFAENLTHETGYECVEADFARSLLKPGSKAGADVPLTALGAALTAQDRGQFALNLVPPSLTEGRERRRLKRRAVQIGMVVASLLIAFALFYVQAVRHRNAYVQELQRRLDEVRPVAEGVQEQEKQLATLREQVDRSGSALELLARLTDCAPTGGLTIIKFSFVHRDMIELQVQATSQAEVDNFTRALRESGVPQFAQASQLGTERQMMEGKELVRCEITIPFPEEAEPEEEPDDE